MYVSRLYLKNWRNFKEVDIPLQPRQFIVGPNASGKSNLLDALRFLRDIAKESGGGLQYAVKKRGGLSRIRFLNARQDTEVVIGVDISEAGDEKNEHVLKWRYAVGINQNKHEQRLHVSSETVEKSGKTILKLPKDGNNNEATFGQTHLEQATQNTEFREVAVFLDSIQYMHLVPQLLRHADEIQGHMLADDPFGQGFLRDIAQEEEGTRKDRLRKISGLLAKVAPELQEIDFERDEIGRPHIIARYNHWRFSGAFQRENQLSDGTLRFIGLAWAMLSGKPDTPLLLEEPELSLHNQIVRKLPGLFHSLQPVLLEGLKTVRRERQLLISTHSAELLSDPGIAPEEILLLHPRKSKGTKIESGSDLDYFQRLIDAGLSIGEIAIPATAPQQSAEL